VKLWLLEKREDLPRDDDPWEPWYDKSAGYVIRAETEMDARQLADANAGDENHDDKDNPRRPWLDSKYSTCVLLTSDGMVGVILRDFMAA